MIESFKERVLEEYFFNGNSCPAPKNIEGALKRKLEILHVATGEQDLRVPPGNRFEHLNGKLKDWCSIRVNKQYRLVFKWDTGKASEVYLDPHQYR
ncbi:type II toxin-antitoxin system RelE/ParE family toxin [Alcanivorax sp. DP30]|uniref:type II toxin-antitoxin system RelE/ParE family toxin n=1 Tax=Alcanivorax sp. DP30 TaxID=2606217 RepID=UPI00136C8175|nr:type II toxin-antitoxin system RelE/ParE family toxin [Alcanivorax sp. DP30]MZR63610.1 toxin [Alcanivorax sp. DP30]